MTDFLITEMTLYPWFTWLLVVFAAVGVGYWCTWVAGSIMFVSDWMTHKRAEWRDDPPEYQHPDEDDRTVLEWMEDAGLRYERPAEEPLAEPDEDKVEAFLARLRDMGIVDEMEDEPPREWSAPVRCDDHECKYYGWVHPPPCREARFTMPGGPAGPPVPWSGYSDSQALHPRSVADLEAAGYRAHDTVDELVDTSFTAAEAMEIVAMTDGTIPIGLLDKGKNDDSD